MRREDQLKKIIDSADWIALKQGRWMDKWTEMEEVEVSLLSCEFRRDVRHLLKLMKPISRPLRKVDNNEVSGMGMLHRYIKRTWAKFENLDAIAYGCRTFSKRGGITFSIVRLKKHVSFIYFLIMSYV